ncbi:hypothetical protein E2C01_050866 [Portunus trituberculatus]|uniref:Uncharacterized protein n=1 Tax=Portunus trituberculatus TaxID=210409 RepID=A0A5B7G9F7_PORTR|nr:hypothetical protein [Portunus trituberculatus]
MSFNTLKKKVIDSEYHVLLTTPLDAAHSRQPQGMRVSPLHSRIRLITPSSGKFERVSMHLLRVLC